MGKLNGKVAVVTGGASGIGLGILRVFAAEGARLALLQRDEGRLAEKRSVLAELNVLEHVADIRRRSEVDAAIAAVVERLGRIDILVNNASVTGKPALGGVLDTSCDQVEAIVDTNLKGTFHCSQAVARILVQQGEGGSIVHVTSVGAYAAQELASVYCATKAAQVSLAQSMALELAPYGIRVNAVAPGDIRTTTSENIVDELARKGATGQFLRKTPLGRRGTPEEIGRAVAFLASDEASFVTGETLVVDGGFLSY